MEENGREHEKPVGSADSIVMKVDCQGKITFLNGFAQRFFGCSLDEVLGKDVRILVRSPENNEQPLAQMIEDTLENPDGFAERINENVLKDGTRVRIYWRNEAMRGSHGDIMGNLAIGRDITKRNQTETMLDAFFEAFPGILVLQDEEFRYIRTDSTTPTYFGLDRRTIVGRTMKDLAPESAEEDESMKREVIETGQPKLNLEVKSHVQSTPEELTWRVSYFPVPLQGGKRGIGIIGVDITDVKKTEEAFHRIVEPFRMLVEGAKDYAVIMLDQKGRVASWNRGAWRMKGYVKKEILGKSFSCFYTPEDIARRTPSRDLAHARRSGQATVEGWRMRKDGYRFWAEVLIIALHDETGQLRGFGEITHDITERKLAQEELLNKSKALEELNNALNVLIEHYKNDQRELEERIVSNIRMRIIPYIQKLRQTRLDTGQAVLAEIIERSFRDIASPFLKTISSEHFRFTPKEIEIISLIKEGKTTKEIAQILALGKRTIDDYRDNIRDKLGLANKKVNLRTYLLSINNT